MSEEPFWTMYHRLGQKEGGSTVQGTRYTKVPEERREGWLEWAAEGIKVGFVGMTRYLGMSSWRVARVVEEWAGPVVVVL